MTIELIQHILICILSFSVISSRFLHRKFQGIKFFAMLRTIVQHCLFKFSIDVRTTEQHIILHNENASLIYKIFRMRLMIKRNLLSSMIICVSFILMISFLHRFVFKRYIKWVLYDISLRSEYDGLRVHDSMEQVEAVYSFFCCWLKKCIYRNIYIGWLIRGPPVVFHFKNMKEWRIIK